MSRRRPVFLRRSIANEERRRLQARSEARAQSAAFRWAAVGVAMVIGLGVMVGFTGAGQALAAQLGGAFGWITAQIGFGLTLADLLAVLAAVGAAAWWVWRDMRRARR